MVTRVRGWKSMKLLIVVALMTIMEEERRTGGCEDF